jgi:tripartite ATP-independent transporter DctM subunit
MAESIILIGAFALVFAVLMLGLPIFVGFLMIELVGVLYIFGFSGAGMLTNSIQSAATSQSLVAIPMFILMGEILFRSGAVGVLFDSVDKLIGGLRGRLYFLTVILSTVFGAISGSAAAVAAMLGKSLIPNMLERGYDKRMSATLVMAGASLAPIIPPSILVIIIGSIANVSIAGLLIAGILPGLMIATICAGWIKAMISRKPQLAPDTNLETHGLGEKCIAFLLMLPFTMVIFSVMGLILLGVATPTESAATGVMGAIACAAIYRKFTVRILLEAIGSTVMISTTILVIIISSVFFGQLLAFSGATSALIGFVAGLEVNPLVVLLLILGVSFVACMFIDPTPYLLITVPILDPIVSTIGFDPIWFWLLYLITLTLGTISPPFGFTMFTLRAAASEHLSMGEIYSSAWPAVLIIVAGMILIIAFPPIATWLPSFL